MEWDEIKRYYRKWWDPTYITDTHIEYPNGHRQKRRNLHSNPSIPEGSKVGGVI